MLSNKKYFQNTFSLTSSVRTFGSGVLTDDNDVLEALITEVLVSLSGVDVIVVNGGVYHWLFATGKLKVSRSNCKTLTKKIK